MKYKHKPKVCTQTPGGTTGKSDPPKSFVLSVLASMALGQSWAVGLDGCDMYWNGLVMVWDQFWVRFVLRKLWWVVIPTCLQKVSVNTIFENDFKKYQLCRVQTVTLKKLELSLYIYIYICVCIHTYVKVWSSYPLLTTLDITIFVCACVLLL